METVKHPSVDRGAGSISVYYCGQESCAAGHFWGPAVRGQYLLHYIAAGCGVYTVGEEHFALSAGECFLIRPGERTVYRADDKDPWSYMWVAFDGFDVPEILRRTGLLGKYTARVTETAAFENYMREMTAEFEKGSLLRVMSCFYGAMSLLESAAEAAPYTREREYADKAAGYIKSHYSYPIRIRDVARQVGIDRTYLYRVFEAAEGMSPKAYLMRVRMEAAKKMLAAGTYSVGETALSCGFSDPSAFCSRFKRLTGQTPTDYITEIRKKNGK